MAKVKFGMFMTDARGKVGGHVLSKNRGGAYVRTKVTPSNPQSAAQSAVRSSFGSIASSWSGLTDEQRSSFNNAVSSYGTTNIFGDIVNPSGKALLQRLNGNLANSDQALLTVCPQVSEVNTGLLTIAEIDLVGETFAINTNGVSTGSKMVIEATAVLSAGTSNAQNKFRKIAVVTGGVNTSPDFYTEYVNRFGAIPAGANIQVRIKFVNAGGLSSPYQRTTAVFV
jgi:hypothetical protein